MRQWLTILFAWSGVFIAGFAAFSWLATNWSPYWCKLTDVFKSMAWITGAMQAVALAALTQVTQAIPGEEHLEMSVFDRLMNQIEEARCAVRRSWLAGVISGIIFVVLAALSCPFVMSHGWWLVGFAGGISFVALSALFRVGIVIFRLAGLRNDLRRETAKESRKLKELAVNEAAKAALAKAENEEAS